MGYFHDEHDHSADYCNDHAHHHHHTAFDVMLELNGAWQGKHLIGDESDAQSGGNVIYLSPGFRLTVDD